MKLKYSFPLYVGGKGVLMQDEYFLSNSINLILIYLLNLFLVKVYIYFSYILYKFYA